MRTTLTKLKLLFITPLMLLQVQNTSAQSMPLDKYIEQGIQENRVLQQKQIAIEKAMIALDQAKALFLPTIDFQAGYQSGAGGRSISIPVGDLMNPVYSTLNQLTSSNRFPQISNSENYFLPNNFLDGKVITTMPLYNSELRFNKQIQGQQQQIRETDLALYKRELVKDIKVAYYNYCAAENAIRIYDNALQLVAEAQRTNEKLLANGKGLPAYVLRAQSEVENMRAKLNEAQQQSTNAKLYFNFLLNSKADQPIDTTLQLTEEQLNATVSLPAAAREENKLWAQQVQLQQTVLKMKQAFALPKINAFVNSGAQAEQLKFNSKSFYYIAGLQLEIPLFHGKKNLLQIKQTQLDLKQSQIAQEDTKQQLELSNQISRNQFNSKKTNYHAAQKVAEASAAYQRLIDKGFKEGVNSFIETIDARTQHIQAQLQVNNSWYQLLIAAAQLERSLATYTYSTQK
ncbi:MAG: hypothetical protein RLY16_2602 [Bacteroidota bacterium]|jgi:outer membrane protein TolC